ncbi:hypothetical protein J6590_106638 [Homalodisca vitripennis]|nr:hypothetical protein J6590_106638 [Homalodisca vitripennis]
MNGIKRGVCLGCALGWGMWVVRRGDAVQQGAEKFVAAVPAAEQHLARLVKQRRAWLLLAWETMERSRPYK